MRSVMVLHGRIADTWYRFLGLKGYDPQLIPIDYRRPAWPGKTSVRNRVWKEWQGRCYICSRRCWRHLGEKNPRRATMDHIYPLSHGGSSDDDNMAIACRSCNDAKASLLPIDLDTDEGQALALGFHEFIVNLHCAIPLRRVL